MTRWIYVKYYLFILSPKFCKASPLFTCFVSVYHCYHYYLFEILHIHVGTYKSKRNNSIQFNNRLPKIHTKYSQNHKGHTHGQMTLFVRHNPVSR